MYEYRARCTNVVDGDTVELDVDVGFHARMKLRFRLLGVDTPELRDPDPAVRERAQAAKAYVQERIVAVQDAALTTRGDTFPLLIQTEKADSFGRWLARVRLPVPTEPLGLPVSDLSAELISRGLASPYQKR